MSEFDIKAAGWDMNPMHRDRSVAIVNELLKKVHVSKETAVLEFGAGTGLTSFLLRERAGKIIMLDNSEGMVRMMDEKIKSSGAENMTVVLFDLERNNWNGNSFDIVITTMVLHHIADIENIINKFYSVLKPGGHLAIADLYPEDGSFHGEGFTGHKGFDPEALSSILRNNRFSNITVEKCFEIRKKISAAETWQFDVFLMVAERKAD